MSMRIAPLPLLMACALLAGAGCASTPTGAGHGQQASAASASAGAAQPGPSDTAPPAAGAAGASAGTANSSQGSATTAASGTGPGQTSDERQAAIDKKLNDSLGSFDAQLRTEQQRVAQERDQRQAAAAGSAATERSGAGRNGDAAGTASPDGADADDKPAGSGRRGPFSRPRDHSGDLKSEKAAKKPDDNAGNGATAREIPDGSDDDVVARRLRQAAEQETDPELKEKLWQEYVDYKKNAQSK